MSATDERASLLQAVLDDPADDQVRLVYADWLEEYGGPKDRTLAGFIRWMTANPQGAFQPMRDVVGMAFLFPEDPVRVTFGVLEANRNRWLRAPYRLFLRTGWRRGFVSVVEWPLADWIKYGPALVRAHPVEEARLSDREPSGRPGEECYWYNTGSPVSRSLWGGRHHLPADVFDRLAGDADVSGNYAHGYATRQAAETDLSDALLLWAKDHARQPQESAP